MILAISIAILAILLMTILIMMIKRSKKHVEEPIQEDYLDQLVLALGGKNNIIKAMKEHQRLKVTVENIKLLNQNILKELELAAFLKGKEVTLLVKHQSEKVLTYLNEQRKGV